ncbi:UNVERIFIED_CONTAM: hypothetical protein HDU68_001707 [Siphonaria sp. JEL0065]|nr:hypothetical protein HDU68_001707 [Siphonaria sp. JEL0065]
MIYLDAFAFLISYSGNIANDVLPLCSQRNSYAIVADLIWCCKDAVKYGYITFRTMTICGIKIRNSKRPCYIVASGSAILYLILMGQVYSFQDPNCEAHFESKIPRISLYVYWTLVDIVAASLIVRKMRRAVTESDELIGDSEDGRALWIIKFREELRLVFVAIGMFVVTIVVIVQTTHPEMPTYRVGTMVFVYCQLFLVIGSQKVQVGEQSSGRTTSDGRKSGGNQNVSRGTIIRACSLRSAKSGDLQSVSGAEHVVHFSEIPAIPTLMSSYLEKE